MGMIKLHQNLLLSYIRLTVCQLPFTLIRTGLFNRLSEASDTLSRHCHEFLVPTRLLV